MCADSAVPTDLVAHLLKVGQFSCPKCHQLQAMKMSAVTKQEVWARVRNMQNSKPGNTGTAALRDVSMKGAARPRDMEVSTVRSQYESRGGASQQNLQFDAMVNSMIEDADEEAEDEDNGATFSVWSDQHFWLVNELLNGHIHVRCVYTWSLRPQVIRRLRVHPLGRVDRGRFRLALAYLSNDSAIKEFICVLFIVTKFLNSAHTAYYDRNVCA